MAEGQTVLLFDSLTAGAIIVTSLPLPLPPSLLLPLLFPLSLPLLQICFNGNIETNGLSVVYQ